MRKLMLDGRLRSAEVGRYANRSRKLGLVPHTCFSVQHGIGHVLAEHARGRGGGERRRTRTEASQAIVPLNSEPAALPGCPIRQKPAPVPEQVAVSQAIKVVTAWRSFSLPP